MFGHARVTTPTCRKYRTFAPPLKFPSYATALGKIAKNDINVSLIVGNKYWLTKKNMNLVSM